jgi:hypothetical protein
VVFCIISRRSTIPRCGHDACPEEQVQRHNVAINRLKAIAGKFNEQVRLFRLKDEKGGGMT